MRTRLVLPLLAATVVGSVGSAGAVPPVPPGPVLLVICVNVRTSGLPPQVPATIGTGCPTPPPAHHQEAGTTIVGVGSVEVDVDS
jgi:hypothetical protein